MDKFRIKQYDRGFVVEVYKPKVRFFIFKTHYWTHYISVSGIDARPWYHISMDIAMRSLLDKIKWDTLDNTNKIKR